MEHLYSSHGLEGGAFFPLADRVIKQLDTDSDGYLSRPELRQLSAVPAHLRFAVQLNQGDPATSTIEFDSASEDVAATDETLVPTPRGVTLRLPGLVVKLELNDALGSVEQGLQLQFAQLDADQNGYLSQDELPPGDELRMQYQRWDRDGDEKISAEEFQAGFALRRQLQETRLQARAATGTDRADGVFALLDRNNDGRLGAREMRFAARWLRQRDTNQDGQLDPEEFPVTTLLTISRGQEQDANTVVMAMPEMAVPPTTGPRWFRAMDTNADGDISRREFIGEARMFELLDANRDEFIDEAEAGNASTSR